MDSTGKPYDEMPTPELTGHLNSMSKRKDPVDKQKMTYIIGILQSRK